jgi:hypothetical protein
MTPPGHPLALGLQAQAHRCHHNTMMLSMSGFRHCRLLSHQYTGGNSDSSLCWVSVLQALNNAAIAASALWVALQRGRFNELSGQYDADVVDADRQRNITHKPLPTRVELLVASRV